MITPMDIHNKTFSKSLRGYSEEEVNDFLRQIVTDYEQIYREHREMEEQMDQMKTKLANYEKISETMTNTLQLAKDTAENVKKNAKRNADILIANAHQEGKRTIRDAEESRRRLMENMIRTEGNMKTYVGKIRRDLELALAAIDAMDKLEVPTMAGFPALEENVRIHGAAPGSRMLWVQGVLPEGSDSVSVHQRTQVFIIQGFDFLYFVAGPEPIEKVQEGHPAMDGR